MVPRTLWREQLPRDFERLDMIPLELHPDRLFSSEPAQRNLARALTRRSMTCRSSARIATPTRSGTRTRLWLDHAFHETFEIRERVTPVSADRIFR